MRLTRHRLKEKLSDHGLKLPKVVWVLDIETTDIKLPKKRQDASVGIVGVLPYKLEGNRYKKQIPIKSDIKKLSYPLPNIVHIRINSCAN